MLEKHWRADRTWEWCLFKLSSWRAHYKEGVDAAIIYLKSDGQYSGGRRGFGLQVKLWQYGFKVNIVC